MKNKSKNTISHLNPASILLVYMLVFISCSTNPVIEEIRFINSTKLDSEYSLNTIFDKTEKIDEVNFDKYLVKVQK